MTKRRVMLSVVAACAVIAARPAAGLAGDDPDDPAVYCKTHGTDDKCLKFKGATSPFHASIDDANSYYDVFLHVAPGADKNSKAAGTLALKVADALRAKGYYVKGVDNQVDRNGGPGVDFFSETDRQGAADVAAVVNDVLPGRAPLLVARAQSGRSTGGILGVWVAAPDGS